MIKQIMICIMVRYYFDIKIYIWEHFELELKPNFKMIQYVYAYVISHLHTNVLLMVVLHIFFYRPLSK